MLFDISALVAALAAHGPAVLAVMALAAVLEAAFGLGVLVPGETVVAAGAAVLAGGPLLPLAWGAVAVGALAGDQVGYVVGRRYGPALARSRAVRRLGTDRWARATDLVRRRGFWVVVVARMLPGVRTLVAATAGAAGVRYGRFLAADAIASTAWAAVWVFGGAALGRVLLGPASWAVVGAVLLGVVVLLVARRRRVGVA